MPVTFNTNNNYNVEIITEPDALSLVNPGVHGAPVAIKYSSTTNTPYIELKITADIYQYPLLAGNMNFDGLNRFLDHHTQNNVNNTCTPPLTPHGINTTNTFGSTNFTGTLANGSYCGVPSITTNVTSSFQGPFQSHRSFGAIFNDKLANGVAWTKVIWVEVYEDDNGQMINTTFSPELNEDLASWQLWDPNNPSRPITNNVHPQYIRAFVFLEFAPYGPGGLTSNVDIFIDIDEDEPVYGCTDLTANNYNSNATIDDGSCTYSPPPPVFTLPPFTFTHTVTQNLVDTIYPTSPGTIVTMLMLTIDVQPAINTWYGSTGVNYEITELYYIDDTGAQVDIERTTNSSLLTPPYGLLPIPPIGLVYYFDPAVGSNISTYTTPAPVLAGFPFNITGVVLPNDGTGFTTDVYCTVTAYDQPANISTSSHTEILTITI